MSYPVTTPLSMKDYSDIHKFLIKSFPHFKLNEVIYTSCGGKYRYLNFCRLLEPSVFYNVTRVLSLLEYFRNFVVCGPIFISSFVRHPDTNSHVGGASKSDHLIGLAVDIRTNEYSDSLVRFILKRLELFKNYCLIRYYKYDPAKSYIHISLYNYDTRTITDY